MLDQLCKIKSQINYNKQKNLDFVTAQLIEITTSTLSETEKIAILDYLQSTTPTRLDKITAQIELAEEDEAKLQKWLQTISQLRENAATIR